MEEIWKDIKDYEGLYQVSNLGRIKRLNSQVESNSSNQHVTFKCKRCFKEKILKPINIKNYMIVSLSNKNEIKQKQIHRLVAQAFIPNPNNLPQINHKNEIKSDNRVENLEWCSAKYNCNYGTRNKKITGRKKVVIKDGIKI